MKEFVVAIGFLAFGSIFVAHNFFDKQSANILGVGHRPLLGNSVAEAVPTPTLEPLCDNYNEIEDFEKPIPVVWTAKMDGCLVSCEGASFTRVPAPTPEGVGVPTKSVGKYKKYPRFAGYYPGELQAELWPDDSILKISGDWVGIDADHPHTVFDNKCVPVIQIKKIEIIK